MSRAEKRRRCFSDSLADLENYHAENVLSQDLKQLYLEVQGNLGDFRKAIFDKNIDRIEEGVGDLDKEYVHHIFDMGDNKKLTKEIKLMPELMEFYKKKAKECN